MTARNEVFDSIKISGLTFENSVTDKFDTSTAGKYPSLNSVLTITDSIGTARFSRNINVDSVSVQTVTATSASFTDISASSISVNTITASTISSGSVISSGPINTTGVRLISDASGLLTIDRFGDLVWKGQSLTEWRTLLEPTAVIPLLPSSASLSDVATTVNDLLTVLKNKGILIS